MSPRSLLTVAGVGLLTAVVAASMFLGLFRHHVTPAELDTLFRTRIPVGSSSQRVEEFLDSVGVRHGAYLPREREIYATWDKTWIGLVGQGAIQVRFLFDDARRLTEYELTEAPVYL
jgi:hypothetical protein